MRILMSIITVFLITLSGCSSQASKPAEVSQEIWDEGISLFNEMTSTIDSGKQVTDEQSQKVRLFYAKHEGNITNLTDKERHLVMGVHGILQSGVAMKLYKAQNDYDKYDETLKGYLNITKEMKEEFKLK